MSRRAAATITPELVAELERIAARANELAEALAEPSSSSSRYPSRQELVVKELDKISRAAGYAVVIARQEVEARP